MAPDLNQGPPEYKAGIESHSGMMFGLYYGKSESAAVVLRKSGIILGFEGIYPSTISLPFLSYQDYTFRYILI